MTVHEWAHRAVRISFVRFPYSRYSRVTQHPPEAPQRALFGPNATTSVLERSVIRDAYYLASD